MSDFGIFVAVSNTTARLCSVDKDGKTSFPWQEAGQQPQGSVNWLKNGKAFLTTQGGSVVAHVVETLKDKDKPPIILSLPSGPLLTRISGDGKCLVLVQSGVPGCINVYDLQSLLVGYGSRCPGCRSLAGGGWGNRCTANTPCGAPVTHCNGLIDC